MEDIIASIPSEVSEQEGRFQNKCDGEGLLCKNDSLLRPFLPYSVPCFVILWDWETDSIWTG